MIKNNIYNRKNLILVFSHEISIEQKDDAVREFGITDFIAMPNEIKQLWGNIPPQLEGLKEYVCKIEEWLLKVAKTGDYILIQGDYGATFILVQFSFENGFVPVYATTKRKAIEKLFDNGEVRIERVFKHVRFRKYGG